MSPVAAVNDKPTVAVCVVVTSSLHPHCVLLGIRKNAFGAGTYALPGGTLEFGEIVEDCGSREISEETGLKLTNLKTECILNVVWLSEQRHFVAIVLCGEVDNTKQQEPDTLEPHKCEGWEWHDWHCLPNNLFLPLMKLKESGYDPFNNKSDYSLKCINMNC